MPHQNELLAIRRVVTRARTQAYLGESPILLGKILDDIQDLLTLTTETEGMDEDTRQQDFTLLLRDIEARYPGFAGIATLPNAVSGAK